MHLVVKPYEASSEAGEGFVRIDFGIGAGIVTDTCGGCISFTDSGALFTGCGCCCGIEADSGPADDGGVCRYCAVRGSLLEMDTVGTEGISTGEKSTEGVCELGPLHWEKQGTRLYQSPALGNPTLHRSCEQHRKISPFRSHLLSQSSWVSWFRDHHQWILGLQVRN